MLLLGLILNVGLAASNAAFFLRQRAHVRGDFVQLFTAGKMVRDGEGARLYDYQLQGERQRALLGGWSFPGGVLPFNYPPHVAMAFAALPLPRAFWVWSAAQAALLIALMRLVGRLAPERPPLERWLLRATVLAAPPLLLTFELGALSLALVVAVLAAYRALATGRERAAGLWLALGTVKLQLMLMPALATLAGRRWRALAALAVAMLIVFASCTAAFGLHVWADFLRAVLAVTHSTERVRGQVPLMLNLEGAIAFAFGPSVYGAAPIIALGGWLFACAATIWIWRGPWQPTLPRFPLQMAATVLLGTFFNLHLYAQDGLMIVAAGLLFELYLRRSGRPRAAFAALAVASPALWLLTELVLTPRLVRFPVALQLALGLLMAREMLRPRTAPSSARS